MGSNLGMFGFVQQFFLCGTECPDRRRGPEVSATYCTCVLPVSDPSWIVEEAFAIGSNKGPVGGRIRPADADSYSR